MTDKVNVLLEKTAGDAAYRRKSYDAAISHYTNAMRLDPTEMTYDYQGCNSIEFFCLRTCPRTCSKSCLNFSEIHKFAVPQH